MRTRQNNRVFRGSGRRPLKVLSAAPTLGRHVSLRIDDDSGGGGDQGRGRPSTGAQLQAASHLERSQEIHLVCKVQSGWESARVCRQAADKLIKIWDATTGDIIQTLSGHSEGISDIAWSAHSDYIASASDDKTVRIWSLDEATVKILRGHTNFVFCVNYNPRSNLLVSGGFDETVRVWDVARGKSLKVLPAHSDPVTAVSFSHDGTLIVSCAMDGLIRIWDADSGQCLKTLVDDDNPVCSHVLFSPNSKYVLASTQDSTIRLWNYQTSRCVKTYTGHTNGTYSLVAAFSSTGGQYVVSGSEDARIYIWDLQSRRLVQTLEGHKDVILAVDTHPTRKLIASASMEKDLTIRLWLWSDE